MFNASLGSSVYLSYRKTTNCQFEQPVLPRRSAFAEKGFDIYKPHKKSVVLPVLVMCQDGRVVSTANLPLRNGAQLRALRLQLDGVTLSQEEMVTQGFTPSLKKQDLQLSYALVLNPLTGMVSEEGL